MPSTPLPGTGATMRMDRAFRARARSSANPVILLILTPRAGSYSKRLTTGPVMMAVTRPSTPKWRRVFSSFSAWASMAFSCTWWFQGGDGSKRSRPGRV